MLCLWSWLVSRVIASPSMQVVKYPTGRTLRRIVGVKRTNDHSGLVAVKSDFLDLIGRCVYWREAELKVDAMAGPRGADFYEGCEV